MQLDSDIKRHMTELAQQQELYWAGGPVRDMLLSRPFLDIDLVMPTRAIEAARRFADNIKGTLVVLDEDHGVARVVGKGCILDFSEFREGANSIEEDLQKRDITINAMAIPAQAALEAFEKYQDDHDLSKPLISGLIDPCNGFADLKSQTIRAVSEENLRSDPLRLIRVFRFMADLNFSVALETELYIKRLAPCVNQAAPERITAELTHIMQSPMAGKAFKRMHASDLLQAILPEIKDMAGVEQPGFHHLDVLEHCFETLSSMDRLVENPAIKFKDAAPFKSWIDSYRSLIPALKWTAFMHDWGKPAQKGEKAGRVTFYNHDRTGAEMVRKVAKRLRWKGKDREFTALMVEMHMRPFHLLPDFRLGGPSRRALRRLLEKAGPHYPALFLQAMADSMAGCGPLKPADLDDELAGLADRVHKFHEKRMQPAIKAPRLITGRDILEIFAIEPGPKVGRLLKAVEAARIEGKIKDRDQAIRLVQDLILHDT